MIAEGTLVRLHDGRSVAVEELLPGTPLHDPMRSTPLHVRFVLRRNLGAVARTLPKRARLSPVLLCQGALSEQRPSRDLLVSPQQPVLIRTLSKRRIPFVSLVSAKALVSAGQAARVSVSEGFVYCAVVTETPGMMLAENVVLKTTAIVELAGAGHSAPPAFPNTAALSQRTHEDEA